MHTSLKKQIVYHIIGWAIFIIYEVSFIELIRGIVVSSLFNAFILPYIINISLFYFHAFVVLRKADNMRRNRLAYLTLLIVLELLIYLFLMSFERWTQLRLYAALWTILYNNKVDFIQQLWRGIYFLIFSSAFWLIFQSFKKERLLKEAETKVLLRQKEKQELELQLVSTRNAFLQAQINPHLLFNTLNFIHSEVQEASPTASEAIITLADMMRYSLTETERNGKVSIEQEVEQIENLIKINQYRFHNALCIELRKEGRFEQEVIAPLLLVPLVENLFKYAVLTDEKNPASICIRETENTLQFSTFNKKRKTVQYSSTGIGIKNVETRLKSFYPGRYSLEIKDEACFFSLNLTIKLR